MITSTDTKYDALLVGAGLSNAVIAHELASAGYRVLVIDKRNAIGGNCHTSEIHGITVHDYGAHIFHTSDEAVWKFATKFDNFIPFVNSPVARAKLDDVTMKCLGRTNEYMFLDLPFNLNTFTTLWPNVHPDDMEAHINALRDKFRKEYPENLEEQALSLVGDRIYNLLIKGYTEKQWGKKCTELPPEIIKRLPLRFTWNNNYFNDKYQGIPEHGYTQWIENMLTYGGQDGGIKVDVWLNTSYKDVKADLDQLTRWVFYSGSVDELMDYTYGDLPYRSLRFTTSVMSRFSDFQGVAVMNYTTDDVPFTRTIEHKHFCPWKGSEGPTVVTTEFPADMTRGAEPYYPMGDENAIDLYLKYLRDIPHGFTLTGRLGLYKYMDMDDCIAESLRIAEGAKNMFSGKIFVNSDLRSIESREAL